jgi:hypothetical protein
MPATVPVPGSLVGIGNAHSNASVGVGELVQHTDNEDHVEGVPKDEVEVVSILAQRLDIESGVPIYQTEYRWYCPVGTS